MIIKVILSAQPKYIIVFVLCLVLLRVDRSFVVHACSGGGELTLTNWIDASDVIVRGHIVQADSLAQNGFLEVDAYLKGGVGAQRIAIQQADPVEVAGEHYLMSSGGECSSLRAGLERGTIAYFFLKRQANGIYTIPWDNLFSAYFRFPDDTTTQYICLQTNESADDCLIEANPTDSEFMHLIIEVTKQQPVLPHDVSFDPLQAPLLLTTSEGSHYLLPLDGSAPMKITNDNADELGYGASDIYSGSDLFESFLCVQACNAQLSADRFFSARHHDANSIAVGYRAVSEQEHEGDTIIDGQGFSFSPAYPWLVVWDSNHLRAYMLNAPFDTDTLLSTPHETAIAPTHADGTLNTATRAILWRPDSTDLVFSNADGLWLWHGFYDQPPILLLSPDNQGNLPEARFFSMSGRYLTFQRGKERGLLDILTGAPFSEYDSFVSPDDNYVALLERNPNFGLQFLFAVCPTKTYSATLDTCIRQFEGDLSQPIIQFTWKTPTEFWYLSCPDQGQRQCHVMLGSVGGSTLQSQPYLQFNGIKLFSYEPAIDHMALLLDSDNIVLNGQSQDLAGQFDGVITTIQWLPSFFCTAQ